MDQGFYHKVYQWVMLIPAGYVASYGQIATALGNPRMARQVGWAMRTCPDDLPWHRVVNSQGGLSTKAVHGAFNPQRDRLEDEGVEFDSQGLIDLARYGWHEIRKE